MKRYLWILLPFLIIWGCEDLEDTYSDYAGDGPIRYLTNCDSITLTPSWNSLIVRWQNNADPIADSVKITWSLDEISHDTLLGKDARECTIPLMQDGNYEIKVCRVAMNGDVSMTATFYGRPYTNAHEEVLAFTRLISKHYFVGNRLVLFFSNWSTDVYYAELQYTKADGTPGSFALEKSVVDSKYMILPDALKSGTEVILLRKGMLENCPDPIEFEPVTLSKEKVYTSDLKVLFEELYDSEITESLVNQTKEIEFDYSVNSFEDILNMPNLKKLVLGKNRYLTNDATDAVKADAKMHDTLRSLFVLQTAQQLMDLKIERYNKHYIPDDLRGYEIEFEEMGNPELPEMDYKEMSDWSITCSEKDAASFDSHLEYLLDADPSTCWQPELQATARTYEVEIDMKSVQGIKGFLLQQKKFAEGDVQSAALMPSVIKVQLSDERKITWTNATNLEEVTLGATNGEQVLIKLPSEKEARYVRFTFYDNPYGSNYSVTLAGINVY